jgi:TRAP-type C4-dicarboxylate transport system permease small subunit
MILTMIRKVSDLSNRAGVLLAEAALLGLMLITTYAVISRYVFSSPSVHAMEISVYLLLVSAWCSIGWIHKVNRHVSMEALNVKLKGRWSRIANAISQLTVLIFCAILIGTGVVAAYTSFEKGYRSPSLLDFPMWLPYALIPIGGILLALVTLGRFGSGEVLENDNTQGF